MKECLSVSINYPDIIRLIKLLSRPGIELVALRFGAWALTTRPAKLAFAYFVFNVKNLKKNPHFYIESNVCSRYVSKYNMYRLDRQCCPSVHCPCGQCRFSPIFLQLLAWAKLDFRVDSGQCRITAAILPEALSTWTMPPFQIFFWGLSQVDASARGIVQHCKIGFQSRFWTMPHYCSNTPRGLRYWMQ